MLIECIPNFSEGRDRATIDAIVDAIRSAGVTLVDHSADPDHHRLVVTFLGTPDAVAEAAFAAAREAVARIDLNRHQGAHPRMGAVDVIPFVPLGDTPMATCVAVAHALGERLGRELALPIYYYEAAALRPDRRDLARVRASGFEALRGPIDQRPTTNDQRPTTTEAPSTEHQAPGTTLDGDRAPDAGPAVVHPTAGAVAVGARGPLIAYNILLDTHDVRVARQIAARVRERGGGLPGVKALGLFLPSRGQAQVSINITDPDRVSLAHVFARVRQEAARLGAGVAGSELVGALRLDDLLAIARDTLDLRDLDRRQVLDLSFDHAPDISR
jgi:glutamate formiminotransferase